MEILYENKAYAQLLKTYEKRIEKMEKDHQKKQEEMEHLLLQHLDKCSQDFEKLERRYERKDKLKKGFKNVFGISSHAQASSEAPVGSLDLDNAKQELAANKKQTRKHHVDLMLKSYDELYRNIRAVKEASVEPVTSFFNVQIVIELLHYTLADEPQ